MLEFPCPHCGSPQQQADHTAGQPGRCSTCGASLVIPYRSQPLEVNPYAAPQGEFVERPQTPRPEIQPGWIDIGQVWRDTWRAFRAQLAPLLGVSCLFLFTIMLPYGAVTTIHAGLQRSAEPWAWQVAQVAFTLVVTLVQTFVTIGWVRVMLAAARGERVQVAELFAGLDVFGRLLWLQVPLAASGWVVAMVADWLAEGVPLVSLAIQVPYFGLIMLFSLVYGQYMTLIADRRLGVLESLRLSQRLTRGNRTAIFLLTIASGAISVAGALCCGVGLIPAAAPSSLLHTFAYLQMTGEQRPIG